jgi:uncharacterized OB-fold protein
VPIVSNEFSQWYRDRPRPLIDNVSRSYWEGTAKGELRYQCCDACGMVQFYPRALCTSCGSEPSWQVSSGRGQVYTFTVIRQNAAPPFRDQVPYVVAMVDVEPGFRMMGNVIGIDPDRVVIGMSVQVEFIAVEDDYAVPVWRSVDEAVGSMGASSSARGVPAVDD